MLVQTNIDAAAIKEATRRVAGHVRQTPVIMLEPEIFGSPASIFLKLEQLQHSGSFKVRGVFNTLLSGTVPRAGVVAASGGNHGAAMAYAAGRIDVPVEIFLPATTSEFKLDRILSYGAKLHVGGSSFQEAVVASRAHAAKTGAMEIHAYDRASVIVGQGTLGPELERQLPSLDTVLVACGGGGLIGGIGAWFEKRVRIVGVEPETAPTVHAALSAGRPVPVPVSGIAVDALGAAEAGKLMFPIAQRAVDRVVLVPDGAIRAAQALLWDELRLMAEPGGATALSALLCGAYRPAAGERIAVLVCGGNVDPKTFA